MSARQDRRLRAATRRVAQWARTDRGTAWVALVLYLLGWSCLTAAAAGVLPRVTRDYVTAGEVVLASLGVLALSYGGVAPLAVFVWEGVRGLVKAGERAEREGY